MLNRLKFRVKLALLACAFLASSYTFAHSLIEDRPDFAKKFSAPNASEASKSLKIFWWNIEKGLTNAQAGDDALNKNLVTLATMPRDQAPDVIALGEFEYDPMNSKTLRALRANYTEIFLPYSVFTADFGMALYVRKDLEVETFPLRELEWAPTPEYRQKWINMDYEAQLFDRYYVRVRVGRPGYSKVNIVPVHLLQPWSMLKKNLEGIYGNDRLGRLRAFFETAAAVLLEKDNPLVRQAQSLSKYLDADFGKNRDREPVVMLGDFNVPQGVGPVTTRGYEVLIQGLKAAFKDTTPTFPAKSAAISKEVRKIHLDHAFVSSLIKKTHAMVLYLKGSDHYPIMVSVEPKPDALSMCRYEELLTSKHPSF